MSSSQNPSKSTKWLKKLFKSKTNQLPASSSGTTAPSNLSDSPQSSTVLENVKISARFAQSILPDIGGCIDVNPVKVVFGILSLIIKVRKDINDNKDALQRVLEETQELLDIVLKEMEVEPNSQRLVNEKIEQYKKEVEQELERIEKLNGLLQASIFNQVDYDNYKTQLMGISQKIAGATRRFNTGMISITGKMMEMVQDDALKERLVKDLRPSKMAEHRFIHNGKDALKRQTCTEGTRVKILKEITEWANDSAVGSPPVFWLTGQAGAGKTTIAYTIAKRFGEGQPTALGASFFCSRQFGETRSLQRIVPTIAFQLARQCEPYRIALFGVDTSDAVDSHSVEEQIQKFLLTPWMTQARRHGLPTYLVVVDALDEIEEVDRSSFLKELLESVDKDNITGLKVLVTSRPDPDIVELCATFPRGAVCRLQDVPIKDAKLDITTYLDVKLKNLAGTPELSKLNEQSAGLFIYAATVVKILTKRKLDKDEQLSLLRPLLSSPSSHFGSIDKLYQRIICDAFSDLDNNLLSTRLSVLYAFLCSAERISSSVAALLVDTKIGIASMVLDSLHAVLYEDSGRVYWYHASFPDFIFNPTRSNFHIGDKEFTFSCDAAALHSFLANACFRIMNSNEIGLRFNMGDIKSSYLLDSEHAEELRENVNKNISPALRYACMHWVHHVSLSPPSKSSPIYDMVTDFLQLRVLFWIEAMHLHGSSGECPHLLHNARNRVLKDGNTNLAKDLLAVAYFASYFISSPAPDSTPHLYISSLATWQSASHLSQSWKDAFSRIPVYKHTGGIITMPIMTKQLDYNVYAITFSPDGKHVVAGLSDTAVVLDASTGREEHVLLFDNSRYVAQVKFSPNGMRLAIVSKSEGVEEDYAVHMWDAPTFQLLHKFNAYRAAVSVEGTDVLTISEADSDGHCQFQVLDISAGTLLRTGEIMMAEPHDKNLLLIGFSSISMRFMIAFKGLVDIWDISSECAPKKVTLDDYMAYGGAMSPGGKLVAMVTSKDNFEAGVFDTSTGYRLFVLPHDQIVHALDFSYDGTHIVSVSYAGTLYIWDAATGTKLKVLKTNSSNFLVSVALTTDGSHIGLSIWDTIHVWSWDNLTDGDCVTQDDSLSDDILTGLQYVAMSDDSKRIMSYNKTKVQVWDASTGTALIAMSIPLPIIKPRMSGNGENIIYCLNDGSVKVLNATTGDEILHLESEVNTRVRSIAIFQSGRKFALSKHTDSGEEWIEIWGLDTGKEKEFAIGKSNYSPLLTFSDDERYIVATTSDSPIVIYDLRTGNTQKIESEINEQHQSLSISGNELAICEDRGDSIPCEVWKISSGKLQNRFELSWSPRNHDGKEDGRILSFGFSSKGKKFVAACLDGYIRVWSAVSNKTVIDVMLVYCAPDLCSIALSRDSELVVTGSVDGFVQVWDLDDHLDMAEKYPWVLTKSGWITSSQNSNHRLMWVSDRLKVKQPRNTLFISGSGNGSVDLSRATIGEDWENCYSPQNSVGKSVN